VSKAVSLGKLMSNVFGVMASKRRLFIVPYLVLELQRLLAEEKGEITAEITSANKLSEKQYSKLAEVLSKSTGHKVRIEPAIDETILGGLIVKVGSKMLDTSIRAKLASLQATMKEVG
jgi:F-type H+-transporting ATPase subunit delta